MDLIYAIPSPNVLAQNDIQPVKFRLKGTTHAPAENLHYFAIKKALVVVLAGIDRSKIPCCPD